ncbi:MAG: SRPBCC family protein [Burkholderiales bacterium]
MDAVISVAVEPDLAWAVLTDYNHPADFVPDLLLSRVIGHEPLHVEQKGETGFLIWRFPIEVVFEIEERPPRAIGFKSVSGNLKTCVASGALPKPRAK